MAHHEAPHEFEGALLSGIMAKVGTPSGKAIRGAELADIVIVEAWTAIKWSSMRSKRVVADRMNGAPLNRDKGPFELIMEGDLRPARAVHSVSAIRLERVR